MPTYEEPSRLSDVLKREWEALYNRESVTLTGSDFAIGAVVNQLATGKWSAYTTPAADADTPVLGVVLFATDASAEDAKATILARGPAVVAEAALVFKDSVSTAGKATALEALTKQGIVARKTL